MSDTPRTDEEVEIAKKFTATSHGLWVSAEFARQLERELSARPEVVSIPLHELNEALCDALNQTPNYEELERLQKLVEAAIATI